MANAEFTLCKSCKKRKPSADYYATIKDVCKSCRKKNNKDEREQTLKEEKSANERRDQDIKKLMAIVAAHEITINSMKKTVENVQERVRKEKAKRSSMKEKLTDAEKRLGELGGLEQMMKGFVLGEKFAK